MNYTEKRRLIEQWEQASDKKEILEILHQLNDLGDEEVAHGVADTLLCNLLTSLGYADVVEAYEGVDKWFA